MIKNTLRALTLLSASFGLHAAPISFVPQASNLDVAFLDFDPGAWFALFDFNENPACDTGRPLRDCRLGNPLLVGNPLQPVTADKIDIEPFGPTHYTATNLLGNGYTIPLLNSPRFILAASFDQGASWWNPARVEFLGTGPNNKIDIYRVDFIGIDTVNRRFDLTTALKFDAHVAAIPLPPAIWLFASGIVGLIAIARKKR